MSREKMLELSGQMETQNNLTEAFKYALIAQRMDPSNPEIQERCRRLHEKIQKFSEEINSTENKVKTTMKYLKDDTADEDKRTTAAKNLIALVRDSSSRKLFIENNGFELLITLMKDTKVCHDIRVTMVRVLAQLVESNVETAQLVYSKIGIPAIIEFMAEQHDDESLIASQSVIQGLLTQFSSYNPKDKKKLDKEKAKKYEQYIDSLMSSIVERINFRMMSPKCRDCLLDTLMVNIDAEAIDWGKKLINGKGFHKLLEVASELIEVFHESSIPITNDTKMHVAMVLEKVYSCMDSDQAREEYRSKTMKFINDLLKDPDSESNIRAASIITTLLNGPIDVGNYCLSQTGIIDMLLQMAKSENVVEQCVASEALIAASTKKDKNQSIAPQGIGILQSLFTVDNPKVKVRALVGLCKLGSVGGSDASHKTLSNESTFELYRTCCEVLTDKNKVEEKEVKKLAAEGLAYLTLNADVKEWLIKDLDTLDRLIEIGKSGELSSFFGVVMTFVNLTNSYDKQEVLPEMVQLAEFAKQHVPQAHKFDASDYVEKRCNVLGNHHITTALVALSRISAKNSREMISRVFNAICERVNLRGIVVQDGGVRVLIDLCLRNNTDVGKRLAAQAISRIAITNDPTLVFPGERALEVVGPIMELLHPDCAALQNFEALMALTNLAQMSVPVRNRILKDCGFSRIENYIYEDHVMLKRSATQCIANLILAQEVRKLFEGDNDRVKYFVILTADEDQDTASAAALALVLLTSISTKSCQKILECKDWHTNLLHLVTCKELQERGLIIVLNMLMSKGDAGKEVLNYPMLELVIALTEQDDPTMKIKRVAQEIVKYAEEFKLIQNVKQLNLNDNLTAK